MVLPPRLLSKIKHQKHQYSIQRQNKECFKLRVVCKTLSENEKKILIIRNSFIFTPFGLVYSRSPTAVLSQKYCLRKTFVGNLRGSPTMFNVIESRLAINSASSNRLAFFRLLYSNCQL